MSADYLDRALRSAGIPILGVSIGRADDRATWRVVFDVSATEAHRTQAQTLITSFVEPTPQQVADDAAARETDRRELKAVALALWECIPAPTMTKAQLQARVLAIYKTLA